MTIQALAEQPWGSAITAYLHYVGFMVAFGALVLEAQTLQKDLNLAAAWRLVVADAVYGLSATIVLGTGILRVMYFGQGTDYYLSNPVFYVKVGIFIVVSLLSLYPTISFVSWIKGLREEKRPKLEFVQVQRLLWFIRGELAGFVLIPLFAAMLARSIQLG